MKNRFRLALLVGILALSLFGTAPGFAFPVDCSLRDGQPCSPQGATSNCTITDSGDGCYYRYPCWCDRAFGPLQWRCGPNPNCVSCPVSNKLPETAPPAEFAVWLLQQETAAPSACL
jgi:hypothetical protein